MQRMLRTVAATAAATATFVIPAGAGATPTRTVGELPVASGERLEIQNVSSDGEHALLAQRSESREVTLWALHTKTGAAKQLGTLPPGGHYGISPLGDWAAWATRPRRACGGTIQRGKTDGADSAQEILLPDRYKTMSVSAMTVAADGRVTVRIGRCDHGSAPSERDNRAILTSDPNSARFRVLAQSRSSTTAWPVSQRGEAFAMCRRTSVRAGYATAQLTVVHAGRNANVRLAKLRYNNPRQVPTCVVSDAGTATMLALRERPGRPPRRPGDYRVAGLTLDAAGKHTFQLSYGIGVPLSGGVLATSPAGREILLGYGTGKAYVINTATGRHGKPIRSARGYTVFLAPSFGGGLILGTPALQWDPFASAILGVGDTRSGRAYQLTVLNPRARTVRSRNVVPADPLDHGERLCFLPSGRLLFEARSEEPGDPSRVEITNAARSRFRALDTSRVGAVTSMSCDAAATGTVLVTAGGSVHEIAADAIDGSPLE